MPLLTAAGGGRSETKDADGVPLGTHHFHCDEIGRNTVGHKARRPCPSRLLSLSRLAPAADAIPVRFSCSV
jgi:hypothetical protein